MNPKKTMRAFYGTKIQEETEMKHEVPDDGKNLNHCVMWISADGRPNTIWYGPYAGAEKQYNWLKKIGIRASLLAKILPVFPEKKEDGG